MTPSFYFVSIALGFIVLVLFLMERRGTTGEWPSLMDAVIVLANTSAAVQVVITSMSLVVRLGPQLGPDGLAFVTIGGFFLFGLPARDVWNRFRGR